MMAFVGKFY